jgi:hypothetical protein
MTTTRLSLVLAALVLSLCVVAPIQSAYKGHADNRDIDAVLATYPAVKGGPGDSCVTCHTGGRVKGISPGSAVRDENHCDFCHAAIVRDKRDVRESLNAFGLAYLAAGRTAAALATIGPADSDGDGASNDAEFRAGTNPGDRASSPSAPAAPSRTYTVAGLKGLARPIEQTVFLNSTKSRSGDGYAHYQGFVLGELLGAIGLREGAESVDLLSVDGYERSFTLVELRKAWPQGVPAMGLGKDDLGPCGWVSYPSKALVAGRPLPAASIMLAFEENGQALETARVDPATGRIVGKGPLRSVVPQFVVSPPDLPQTADPACSARVAPEFRFHEAYDHNAGASQSALVAIRVKPLPKGTRDVDWLTGAQERLAHEELVVFGAIR